MNQKRVIIRDDADISDFFVETREKISRHYGKLTIYLAYDTTGTEAAMHGRVINNITSWNEDSKYRALIDSLMNNGADFNKDLAAWIFTPPSKKSISVKHQRYLFDYTLLDTKSSGTRWVFGYFSETPSKLAKKYGFKSTNSLTEKCYFADLYNANIDSVAEHPGERVNQIIGIISRRPNMNIGLSEFSDLCRGISCRDWVDLTSFLGMPKGDIHKILADRYASILMNDFQRSPDTAKKILEKLKERAGE